MPREPFAATRGASTSSGAFARAPRPFETRVCSAVGDTTLLVGHDRTGARLVELRVSSALRAPATLREFRTLVRALDAAKWSVDGEAG